MNKIVMQDPLFLVLVGFGLAMTLVIVMLMTRRSQYPPPGYGAPPTPNPAANPGNRLGVGCVFYPLLIASLAVLLALLS